MSRWHRDVCLICSVSLDCEKQFSDIRAIPTQQGYGILFQPPEFRTKPRRLQWPNFRSTCQVHLAGTLPNALLVHYHCILILCWVRRNAPILALTSTLPQISQPCFEPPPSRLEFDIYRMFDHVKDPLVQRLMEAPVELFNAITAYLPPDQALAVASIRDALVLSPRRLISPYRSSVSEIIKSYSSRRRLAHLYEVASYLQGQNVEVGSRDREVGLSPETNAVFVAVGGRRYLHDFCDGDHLASNGRSGFSTVWMGLKNPNQVALMVDEFGIVDVAFEEDNGQLQWILGTEPTTRNIFLERAPTGILSSIKVTYDSIKCRSIRLLPCSGARPRPLLLPNSGQWIPWSFYLGTLFTFPHDDYFIPTVTDIVTPGIIYISYRRDGVISGIHNKPEGNCTQILLGPPAETRSVKFLVLCHSITKSQIPCIQFIHNNRAIPPLPTAFNVQKEEVHSEVKAIWWSNTWRSGFLFNVIK
ncbi:hypothetical protein KJE20_03561 [Pyrenophora tritici-repentis]|uniref:Uncharacterized protein n=1 Tax=Pyrenophora tritici-repentis TaxID=45151 RepID=A0A922STF6_9PLEO|nr:hypothetical protein Ptr86124_012967 [Pyrenophora tritici-repentis]KAI1690383.1 hypothetical protein KJE20_03561 [Pyrenophora tritici-repentis]